MTDNIEMNASYGEVVHPQDESTETLSANFEEAAHPQDAAGQAADETLNADSEEVVHPQADDSEPALNAQQNASGEEVVPSQSEKPYKVFASSEEYQNEINGIIGKRLGDTRVARDKAEKYDRINGMIAKLYGAEEGDAALAAFEQAYYDEQSERMGVPADTLRQMNQQEQELEMFRNREKQAEEQSRVNQLLAGWRSQEEELKKEFPDFSLNAECESDAFIASLKKGLTVKEAYILNHFADLAKEARQQGANQAVNSIQSRQSRPAENGMTAASGASAYRDVSKMSDSELDDIVQRVRNGERIDFKI